MPDWNRFVPTDFEYDFENDKLRTHGIRFEEALECFFADFQVRRNKSFRDRYQLIGRTVGGRTIENHFSTKIRQRCPNYHRMANMSKKQPGKLPDQLTEAEIDAIVIDQADDDAAWEEPIDVQAPVPLSVHLTPELARRAAFFARLHKKTSTEEWLQTIIQERINFEEAAFAGLKQAIAETQSSYG